MSEEKKKTRSIEKTVTIAAPPEEVWKALSEGEGIKAWFAPDARVTPGAGGKVFLSWGPGMEGASTIEIWEPNQRMRTRDSRSEQPGRAEIAVDYILEGKGGTTTLRLVHSGFGAGADWDAELDNTSRGWDVFMSNLRYYLEHQRGKPCTQTIAMLPLPGKAETAWEQLIGPCCLGVAGRKQGETFEVRTAAGDALKGQVTTMAAPNMLILDVENLATRITLTLENGYLFAALLSYGPAGEAFATKWKATVEPAVK